MLLLLLGWLLLFFLALIVEVLLYVHRNRRFIRDVSPGCSPRLSHSSWALSVLGMKPKDCCCYSWHEVKSFVILGLKPKDCCCCYSRHKTRNSFCRNAVVHTSLGSHVFFSVGAVRLSFCSILVSFFCVTDFSLDVDFLISDIFPIYFSCHYSVRCSFRSLLAMLFRVTDLSLDVDILIPDISPHLFQLSL